MHTMRAGGFYHYAIEIYIYIYMYIIKVLKKLNERETEESPGKGLLPEVPQSSQRGRIGELSTFAIGELSTFAKPIRTKSQKVRPVVYQCGIGQEKCSGGYGCCTGYLGAGGPGRV